MSREKPEAKSAADSALGHLDELAEETMRRAWGAGTSPEDRRRIVLAAVLFGRLFEEHAWKSPPRGELEQRRFLMGLMNDVVREFAGIEGMSRDAAAEFLGDVSIRDYVLELDEVLDAYAGDSPGRTLDELRREAVDSRPYRARRPD